MKKANPLYSKNFKYLLRLIASVLSGGAPPEPNDDTDWASVFYLSQLHSVAGMTAFAVDKLSKTVSVPEDILNSFDDARKSELILESNIEFETSRILKILASENITVLPLKGITIKHYYPEPCMRTMSDVDILYKKTDKDKLIRLFTARGYEYIEKRDYELDFSKQPFNHYEFHATLVSSDKVSDTYFSTIWDKVIFEDSSVGSLSASDSYIYMMEHIAKHMEKGGAGLRMVLDVCVFLKAQRDNMDWDYVNKVLSSLNLLDFSEKISELADNWFLSDNPDTDSVVADYILCSCTFGNSGNAILQESLRNEKRAGKKHSGFYNLLHRIFPSYNYLCSYNPDKKRFKVFYPFYVFTYWCRRIFCDRNVNTGNLKKYMQRADSDDGKRIMQVMKDLGLSSRM